MSVHLKRLTYSFLALAAIFSLFSFLRTQREGFSPSKIISALHPSPSFNNSFLSEEEQDRLKTLLSHPFTYLGKGAQSYVFLSDTGDVVIKFCRFDHLRPSRLYTWIHLPFSSLERERLEKMCHRRRRLEAEFLSHQIAFDHLKEETGLIYLQLNKTSSWKQTITLFDKLHLSHTFSLDNMEFLVQKKASPFYQTLDCWIQEGKEEMIQKSLSSLLILITSRYQKGIFDKDPDLATNFGFLDTAPIQIDTGRFSFYNRESPPFTLQEELSRITKPLCEWLATKDPLSHLYLQKELLRLCEAHASGS